MSLLYFEPPDHSLPLKDGGIVGYFGTHQTQKLIKSVREL
ncbi:hypothetical protein SPLC1_S360770 [Arthrospira platensis C1]|nr:hypothetical protein SPLC1_S360770 [Arthrospira platensis C1]